jgi:hypothetical protein
VERSGKGLEKHGPARVKVVIEGRRAEPRLATHGHVLTSQVPGERIAQIVRPCRGIAIRKIGGTDREKTGDADSRHSRILTSQRVPDAELSVGERFFRSGLQPVVHESVKGPVNDSGAENMRVGNRQNPIPDFDRPPVAGRLEGVGSIQGEHGLISRHA